MHHWARVHHSNRDPKLLPSTRTVIKLNEEIEPTMLLGPLNKCLRHFFHGSVWILLYPEGRGASLCGLVFQRPALFFALRSKKCIYIFLIHIIFQDLKTKKKTYSIFYVTISEQSAKRNFSFHLPNTFSISFLAGYC